MNERPSALYTGSLISTVIGALLLIAFDFAGWYERNQSFEAWSYVGLLTGPRGFLLVGGTAALLLFGAYVSYRALRPGESPPSPEVVRYAFLASLAALAVVVLGGLYFVIAMLSDEPADWWFDGGFYGGLLGSGLAAVFFHLAQRESLPAEPPTEG